MPLRLSRCDVLLECHVCRTMSVINAHEVNTETKSGLRNTLAADSENGLDCFAGRNWDAIRKAVISVAGQTTPERPDQESLYTRRKPLDSPAQAHSLEKLDSLTNALSSGVQIRTLLSRPCENRRSSFSTGTCQLCRADIRSWMPFVLLSVIRFEPTWLP